MKLSLAVGAAALLMGSGLAAQAQNPVANLEPTNTNNFNVTVVDPNNNQVTPVAGLGLESNAQVTWLSGDPVKIVVPGKCYVTLPTFQGVNPAATPCCPGTLTQLTSITVNDSLCALPAAIPLAGGVGMASAWPYILGGAALLGGIAAIVANQDDDDEIVRPQQAVSPSSVF